MRRSLAFVASLSLLAIAASCGDDPPTKQPVLSLAYRPNPPVAGQPIELEVKGSNLGVVEIYQGADLLTRIVNPPEKDVPAGFFTFIAKSAVPPRGVAYDADGKTVEVTAVPAIGQVVTPVDSGAPIVDSGPIVPPDPGPRPEFTTTCPGFQDLGDGGLECGPTTTAMTTTFRNERAGELTIWYGITQFNICNARRFNIDPGEEKAGTFSDDHYVEIYEGNVRLAGYRVRKGASAPCFLVVR